MKDKLNVLFQALTLFSFLSILVIDHFEQITIPLSLPLVAIVIFVIAAGVTTDISKPITPRTKLTRNMVFTVLFVICLYVLDLLGGVAESGIGFNNPLVWVLVVLSASFSFIGYKKTLNTRE